MSAAVHDYDMLLKNQFIKFDSLRQHLICLPHRFHVAVSAMLKKCSSISREEAALHPDSSIAPIIGVNTTSLAEVLSRDPMAKLQYLGNDVRVSWLKHQKFKVVIAFINERRA
ncbi:hypothetical protein M422DRAFT_267216 [Sphaerobolus stellatus SS14]|uniref:Unplaced genomic scaffold SPHSTscaffold_172, whole genome shotgun sequence n=1 Tax=Sphaerobolus stellatus (strain SS14) TaxID=990650 RepID=A0A0C9TME8_SPHS4|nr:hypothetical protein M422DRAFT_267216 [Sphaerobolus stellatus SS14]